MDDLDITADEMNRRRRRPGKARRQKHHLDIIEEPLDGHALMNLNPPQNEPVLGTYSGSEWFDLQVRRQRHFNGEKTLHVNQTWLTETGFALSEWVKKEAFPTFTFFSDNYVVIPSETGFMQITSSKNKIVVELVGDIEFCEKSEKFFAARFKKAENLIRWVYNQRGDDISVPLNYRPGLNAAYPWLGRPYSEYIADYLNSEASVLILIGPPGTGKTTFIKNIIHQSRGNARVAYDEKVLGGDDFFASFVDGDDDILVMEDADTFLSDRQDGNTMMHKFLNVSDGLISAIGKKMIFSTNLPNVNDIDPALMRAGRCFDVMEFRPLTREEAQEVLKEVGSDRALPDGRSFTLADIFSTQEHGEQARRNKTGFI